MELDDLLDDINREREREREGEKKHNTGCHRLTRATSKTKKTFAFQNDFAFEFEFCEEVERISCIAAADNSLLVIPNSE